MHPSVLLDLFALEKCRDFFLRKKKNVNGDSGEHKGSFKELLFHYTDMDLVQPERDAVVLQSWCFTKLAEPSSVKCELGSRC